MTDNEIIKAFDILDKFEFFGGQRAGRELWFNANKYGLDTDKENRQLKAEIERLEAMIEAIEEHFNPLPFKNKFDEYIEKAKTEAIKEFAEKLETLGARNNAGLIIFVSDKIDNLVKEMTEGEK